MDISIQQDIDELNQLLQQAGIDTKDPVTKLILTTLAHQTRKLKDEVDRMPQRVMERLCHTFIPRNKIGATPAMCLVQPHLKKKKDMMPHSVGDGTVFTYRLNTKQIINYSPIYKTTLLPYNSYSLLTPNLLRLGDSKSVVSNCRKGLVWIGLEVENDIDSMCQMSFMIMGTGGVMPQRIIVGDDRELAFSPAYDLANLTMPYPFDAQQSQPSFFEVLINWRNTLSDPEMPQLMYITDQLVDRDVFRCRPFPRAFQQMLESNDLDRFPDNTLWILFDFGSDYVVPDDIDIVPNIVPVTNVSLNNVTLTQTSPIAKLTKDDTEAFLQIVETSTASNRQGFNMTYDDVVVRDFDATVYNRDTLYRDVRNLYNHFVDDYHAFIDYHGLKDGELIKSLREMVNRIGRSVNGNDGHNAYDHGTYVMRNINQANQTNIIKIYYLNTNGQLGNNPVRGQSMENKKDAAIEKEITIVTDARGGKDPANADLRHEMLRYYTMTADRLFTRMDIDAFVRLTLINTFGKSETGRINYDITIEGSAGDYGLRRGLYIDIRFKDRKNYDIAINRAFDCYLQRQITVRSCLSIPVIVSLTEPQN